jgi:6-pyruvoyltetrahydropterin/6-carboxytetrahydropterin synthase
MQRVVDTSSGGVLRKPHTNTKKPRKFRGKHCTICGLPVISSNYQQRDCDSCRVAIQKPNLCKCGCGKIVRTPGYLYAAGHKNKGKSYSEIYGTSLPKCGFRKGEENAAKRPEVKRKISEKVTMSYTPELREKRSLEMIERIKSGKTKWGQFRVTYGNERYRSKFELAVRMNFEKWGLQFDYKKNYEQLIHLGKRRFLPDFTFYPEDVIGKGCLNHNDLPPSGHVVLVEVTGSTYSDWRKSFLDRLDYIFSHDLTDTYRVIIITWPDVYWYYSFLRYKYPGKVSVFSYGNSSRLLEHVKYLDIKDVTNIDYTHLLPWHTGLCRRFHGHSSSISVQVGGVFGMEVEPWLLDFSVIKKVVKEECSKFDHIFIVNRNLAKVQAIDKKRYRIQYKNEEGDYSLTLPKTNVLLIEGDSTVENLSALLAENITKRLPDSIFSVMVRMDEGLKSSCSSVWSRDEGECRIFNEKEFLDILRYYLLYR